MSEKNSSKNNDTPETTQQEIDTLQNRIQRLEKENRQLLHKIHQEGDFYRTLFSNMSEAVCVYELVYNTNDEPQDYRVIAVNPQFVAMLGLDEEHIIGQLGSDLWGVKKPPYLETFNHVVQTGEPTSFEIFLERFDKTVKISAFWAGQSSCAALFTDMTKQKQTETALHESMSVLQATLESTADGILVVDNNGKWTRYNSKFIELWKIPQSIQESGDDEKALEFVLDQLAAPQEFIAKVKELYSKPQAESFDLIEFKDGRFFERYSQPQILDEEIKGRVWSFRDVTAQKKAEIALRENETDLRITLQSIGDAVICTDIEGRIVRMNAVAEQLTGFPLSEAEGKPLKKVFNIVNAHTRKPVEAPVKKVLEEGRIVGLANHTMLIARDGTEYQIADSAAPIKDADQNIRGVVLVFRDVTEAYEKDQLLKASEEKFRTLVNQTIDMLLLHEPDGTIVEVNRTAVEKYGYSREELLDMNVADLDPDYKNRVQSSAFQRPLALNESHHFEARQQRKDGTIFPAEVVVTKIKLREKEYLMGLGRDISERKQAEQALRYEKHLFQTLVDNLPDKIFFKDKNHHFIRVNKAKAAEQNTIPEQMIGKSDFDYFPAKIARATCKDDQQVLDSGEPIIDKEEMIKAGDETQWVAVTKLPLYDENGCITGTMGLARDITESKRAAEQLKKSEEKYRLLAENSVDIIWQMDLRLIFTYVSPAAESFSGKKPEEWIGSRLSEHVSRKEFFRLARQAVIAIKNYKTFSSLTMETTMKHKDGSDIPVEITGKLILNDKGKPVGLQGTTKEISQRKQAEAKIRQQIENMKFLSDTALDFIQQRVQDNLHYYIAHQVYEFLGQSAYVLITSFDEHSQRARIEHFEGLGKKLEKVTRLLGQHPAGFEFKIHPDLKQKLLTQKFIKRENDFHELTNGKIPKSVSKALLGTLNVNHIYDMGISKDQILYGTVVIGLCDHQELEKANVLEAFLKQASIAMQKKQAEDKFQENKSLLKRAQKIAHLGSWEMDVTTGQSKWSDEMYRICGYEPQSFKPTRDRVFDIIHPEDRKKAAEALERTIQSGSNYELEKRIVRPDGEIRWVLAQGEVIANGDGKSKKITGSFLDITERKKAQQNEERLRQELLQAQKMESIGRLAGGVAHDFNNMLTVIQGHSQMAMMRMDKSAKYYNDLKQINKAAIRAANLTRQLLLFSRKQESEFAPVNLNKTIRGLSKMLGRLVGEDIKIHENLEEKVRLVRADEGQIEQVITNLVVNARDAMTDGGDIKVTTENVIIKKKDDRNAEVRPGQYVKLAIEDTGPGIDEKIINKIFDPFFSTKGPGRGTGMGLSVVHGIVKKHEGWINVESSPGKGTLFEIFLPLSSEQEKEEKEDEIIVEDLKGNGENVLIVEDEQDVLHYIARVIEYHNYNVCKATNAKQALELFNSNKDIRLLISDIVMPDMSGDVLADKLKSEKSDLKVILSSGYTADRIDKSTIREKGYQFVQKPYNFNELLKNMKKLLAQ